MEEPHHITPSAPLSLSCSLSCNRYPPHRESCSCRTEEEAKDEANRESDDWMPAEEFLGSGASSEREFTLRLEFFIYELVLPRSRSSVSDLVQLHRRHQLQSWQPNARARNPPYRPTKALARKPRRVRMNTRRECAPSGARSAASAIIL